MGQAMICNASKLKKIKTEQKKENRPSFDKVS